VTEAACAARVERGDPERFASVMAAPMAYRGRLFVLYAFNLEVARAPWVSAEPLIAEMRLQWWRDEVTQPRPRAHEVAGPLHALIARGLPLDVIDRLIAARLRDSQRDAFADETALDAYLDDTGGGLMWLAACACGAVPKAEPVARGFGWATGLAGYLRAVPVLEARGRVPLVNGRPEAVAALALRGLDRLAQARRGRHLMPSAAALAGWQTEALLRQVVANPRCVAAGGMGLSEFQRRGRLAWQAATGRW